MYRPMRSFADKSPNLFDEACLDIDVILHSHRVSSMMLARLARFSQRKSIAAASWNVTVVNQRVKSFFDAAVTAMAD